MKHIINDLESFSDDSVIEQIKAKCQDVFLREKL